MNASNQKNGILAGFIPALLAICVAVTAALQCRFIYGWAIDAFSLAARSGLSKETLMENYRILVRYNTPFGPDTLQFPDFPMSHAGVVHFAEVRTIFLLFAYAIPVLLAVFLLQVVRARRAARQADAQSELVAGSASGTSVAATEMTQAQAAAKAEETGALSDPRGGSNPWVFLRNGAVLALILPAVLGLLCAADWEGTFVRFHEIVFDNDYWIFDAVTDPVITVLPDRFFLWEAVAIFLILALQAVGLFLWYRILSRRGDRSSEKAAR